jgi:hypothetical protein
VLLPGGVSSRIVNSERNRQDRFGESRHEPFAGVGDFGLDPVDIGRLGVEAVRESRFLVFAYPQAWCAGMRESLDARHAQLIEGLESGGIASDRFPA